uniref:receptor tyrosine-protein kinase erbB-4-like n=1 Tax=Myxine glutinosa TaxID=7769 RepID=UPI00358EB9D1
MLLPSVFCLLPPLLLLLLLPSARTGSSYQVCSGTENKLSVSATRELQYQALRKTYEDCEVVLGNLEIVNIGRDKDISFLRSIREVSGYVLISLNEFDFLPLENLRIIRGTKLFNGMYALSVFVNYHKSSRLRRRRPRSGLKELRLRSLTEILNGGVQISENQHLCYQDTIEWDDIVKDTNVSVSVERECLPCNKNCNGHCWGSGRNYCQHFTRLNCVAQCDSRCYGPKLSQCCNGQCAAGCSGPQNTHCFVRKNWWYQLSLGSWSLPLIKGRGKEDFNSQFFVHISFSKIARHMEKLANDKKNNLSLETTRDFTLKGPRKHLP